MKQMESAVRDNAAPKAPGRRLPPAHAEMGDIPPRNQPLLDYREGAI